MKEPKPQLSEVGNGAFWQLYRAGSRREEEEKLGRLMCTHNSRPVDGYIADCAVRFDPVWTQNPNLIMWNTHGIETERTIGR